METVTEVINEVLYKRTIIKKEKSNKSIKKDAFLSIVKQGATINISRYLIEVLDITSEKKVQVINQKLKNEDKGDLLISFIDVNDEIVLQEKESDEKYLFDLNHYSKTNNNDWRILSTQLNKYIYNFFNCKDIIDENRKSIKINVDIFHPILIDRKVFYKLIDPNKN